MSIQSRALGILGVAWLLFTSGMGAQESQWHNPTPHNVQFVTVEPTVRLEVLDFGGSGRAVILLAGEGGNAHVWDDFAPKLTSGYRVYAITRRGYGESSAPATGYSADRLGDDVLEVMAALKLDKPVLAGHSIAGEELSSIGSRYPERVACLIYLDAAYAYAFYDSIHAQGEDLTVDINELRNQIDRLQSGAENPRPLIQQLLQTTIPTMEKDLKVRQDSSNHPRLPNAPAPTTADFASFAAYQAYQKRVLGWPRTEGNLRGQFEVTPDGHLGKSRLSPALHAAMMAGEQKYTSVKVPVLAIFASPADPGPLAHNDTEALAGFEAYDAAITAAQIDAVRSAAPSAHIVLLPQANHAIFISNEADCLREMRAFLATLG